MDLCHRRFCKPVWSGPCNFSCHRDRTYVLRGMARSYKGPYCNYKKRAEENSRCQGDGCTWIYRHCFALLSVDKIQLCLSSDQSGDCFCAHGSFTISSPVGAETAGSHSICRQCNRYFPDKHVSFVWIKDLVAISANHGANQCRRDLIAFRSSFLGEKGKDLIIYLG